MYFSSPFPSYFSTNSLKSTSLESEQVTAIPYTSCLFFPRLLPFPCSLTLRLSFLPASPATGQLSHVTATPRFGKRRGASQMAFFQTLGLLFSTKNRILVTALRSRLYPSLEHAAAHHVMLGARRLSPCQAFQVATRKKKGKKKRKLSFYKASIQFVFFVSQGK